MERDDRHAALGAMGSQGRGEHGLGFIVEGIGRLIQQPERGPARDDPGQRQAPSLAGGEKSGGKGCERSDAEGGQRRLDRPVPAPEAEILGYAQGRLACFA